MAQLIGTAPNQVPTNGDLGTAAYMDTSAFYGTGQSASFRNRIINGAMAIDQRSTGALKTFSVNTGGYTVDRFVVAKTNGWTNGYTAQQVTDAPAGFISSLKLTQGGTADSLASNTYSYIGQFLEGYNMADLGWGTANAKSGTLSFWAKSSIVGNFSFSAYNGGAQSYVTTYSIPVANTWTYITITIPGPTSGSFDTTNGSSLLLIWGLGINFYTVPAGNSWQSGNNLGATGAAVLWTTSNATFQLTGVQFEKGTVATPFEYRPIGTELQLCQRYCRTVMNGETAGFGFCNGSANFYMFDYGTPMRSTPSLSYSGALNPTNYSSNISTVTGVNAITTTANGGGVRTAFALNSSPSAQACGLNPNNNLILIISEL